MSPSQSVTVKQPSAQKSLRQFLDTLEIKPNTAVRRFCANKSKRKSIRSGSMFCSGITKMQGHSKINQQVKQDLYNFIDNIYRLCSPQYQIIV